MELDQTVCAVCHRRIVFPNQGKTCVICGTAVHLDCEPHSLCQACGHPYECLERVVPSLVEANWGSE